MFSSSGLDFLVPVSGWAHPDFLSKKEERMILQSKSVLMKASNTALCLYLTESSSFNKSVILGLTMKIHLRSKYIISFFKMNNLPSVYIRHS